MKVRGELIPLAVTLLAAAIIAFSGIMHGRQGPAGPDCPDISCVLDIKCLSDSSSALIAGFNYHILQNFASSCGMEIHISFAEEGMEYRDSLTSGSLDLMTVPIFTTITEDGLPSSIPIDSLTVLLAGPDKERLIQSFNDWYEDWSRTDDFLAAKDMFLIHPSPFSDSGRDFISPYDPLIKAHADSTGTDWRFLAAVMYKESRFHIEAGSHRGAVGLMQIKPSTARYLEIDNPADPEDNIKAGAMYISRLERYYRRKAADGEELRKFVLAAYNAGMGRIDECMSYAELRGKDSSRWEEITEVIPEMSDSSVVESGVLKYGKFLGKETIYFVDKVTDLYHQFYRICPD